MKGLNQNFEKAIRPVFTELYTRIQTQLHYSLFMLRHYAEWILATARIYSLLSAQHGKFEKLLQVKGHLTFQLKA